MQENNRTDWPGQCGSKSRIAQQRHSDLGFISSNSLFPDVSGKLRRVSDCAHGAAPCGLQASVHEFYRSHETFPAMREHLSNFFLPRQCIWNREIVLSENSPNLPSCEQVSRVVNWA